MITLQLEYSRPTQTDQVKTSLSLIPNKHLCVVGRRPMIVFRRMTQSETEHLKPLREIRLIACAFLKMRSPG